MKKILPIISQLSIVAFLVYCIQLLVAFKHEMTSLLVPTFLKVDQIVVIGFGIAVAALVITIAWLLIHLDKSFQKNKE